MLNQKPLLKLTNFDLGVDDDQEKFMDGKLAYAESIDLFTRPGVATLAYKAVAETEADAANDITDLIFWMDDMNDLNKNTIEPYGYGNGTLYRRNHSSRSSNGNKWFKLHTSALSAGDEGGLRNFGTTTDGGANIDPTMYWATNAEIGRYYYDQNATSEVFTDAYKNFTDDDIRWHPMLFYGGAGGLCVGDGRYIAVLDADGTTWDPVALVLPEGVRVRCLAVSNSGDRLIIGTWTVTDPTLSGTNQEFPKISELFTWDGTTNTFNERMTIHDGRTNAVFNFEERTVIFSGVTGNMRRWAGLSTPVETRFPIFDPDSNPSTGASLELGHLEVMPDAIASDESKLLVGFSNTATSGIDNGNRPYIFQYARRDSDSPYAITAKYIPSSGAQTDLRIGSIHISSQGGIKTIYFSWDDGTNKGMDSIPQSIHADGHIVTARIKLPTKNFLIKGIKVHADTMNPSGVSGESVVIKYKTNKDTSFTTLGTLTETNQEDIIRVQKRGQWIQFRIDINGASTGGRHMLGVTAIDIF